MTAKKELAIYGGKPVRDTYLTYGRQWLDEKDLQAVENVLKSDYLTTGPSVEAFERKIAKYVGAKYAVAFSSGTAALHGACFAADISKDDEVITTPLTFVATANCVLYQGGKPVFADIHPKTYTIDPNCIKQLITEKTKAIIPVDFTGQPADLTEIYHLAREHNLIVIEDAAHALGASYHGGKIGSLSDMTMFSFHPVKHITTGEGGMITTNNKGYYDKLLQFRSHGITRDRKLFHHDYGPWYYEMQSLGYNYRITDIQTALGSSQLEKLDQYIERRKRYVEQYNKAFIHSEQIRIPFQENDRQSSWHIYVIYLKLEQLTVGRKEIFEALLKENIGVNVHYIPVYYQPYYQELGYQKGLCPIAEDVYERIITLPLFSSMSEADVDDVIAAVDKVISYYAKGDA